MFGIACVLVFPQVFFLFTDTLNGMLYDFAIFSMTFVSWPFGTAIFMGIQRQWGRSVKLTVSLFLLGTVTANFAPRFRYTGAALTSDFAWLFGAAFAPLIALGLSVHFGLSAVSWYLISGALCTLLALYINRRLEAAA